MTDLSEQLNGLLQERKTAPIQPFAYSVERVDDFLKEGYQIQSRIVELLEFLRSIRRPYLSTAPPPRQSRFAGSQNKPRRPSQQYLSNAERDAIDTEAKATWRDISATIARLAQAEKVRRDTERALVEQRRRKKGLGALGSWASGGAALQKSPEDEEQDGRMSGLGAFRESVIWFLNRGLEQCGHVQSSMMEIRISRELEKGKSVLSQAQGAKLTTGMDTSAAASASSSFAGKPDQARGALADEDADRAMSQQLSQEQMQLFAEENKNMLKHYEDQLGKVRAAEKSLLEISELQATLAANLQIQSAHIDQLVQDSFQTTQDVSKGNVELKKATQRRSTAKLVFWSSLGLCGFLVGWDLIF